MDLRLQNRLVSTLALLTIISALVAPGFGQASADQENTVELTREDLFGLPVWQHKRIAIDGFTLGISREQAFEIAKSQHLSLTPNGPPTTIGELTAPCIQASCSVGQIHGNAIGLDLFFDNDRITKIKASVPADAYPEVKKVNIAREFKGLTSQFFNHYSNGLRNRILGSAEGKETHDKLSTGPDYFYTHIEYDYLHAGVIVHVTVSKRDPEPFDLEVDFVSPN